MIDEDLEIDPMLIALVEGFQDSGTPLSCWLLMVRAIWALASLSIAFTDFRLLTPLMLPVMVALIVAYEVVRHLEMGVERLRSFEREQDALRGV